MYAPAHQDTGHRGHRDPRVRATIRAIGGSGCQVYGIIPIVQSSARVRAASTTLSPASPHRVCARRRPHCRHLPNYGFAPARHAPRRRTRRKWPRSIGAGGPRARCSSHERRPRGSSYPAGSLGLGGLSVRSCASAAVRKASASRRPRETAAARRAPGEDPQSSKPHSWPCGGRR